MTIETEAHDIFAALKNIEQHLTTGFSSSSSVHVDIKEHVPVTIEAGTPVVASAPEPAPAPQRAPVGRPPQQVTTVNSWL